MAVEKNKIISIRLTQEEYDKLKQLADQTGWSISELIRNKIFKKRKKLTPRKDVKRLLYELNRIGNNVNQIAKHCNLNKAVDRVVARELIEIKSILEKLANDC